MKYVVDSSVAFKWVVTEPLSDKRAERQKRIQAPQGGGLWADVMRTCPRLVPSLAFVPRGYAIASQFRIGFYDCLYVAVAENEKCELVTADDKLVNNLQGQFPFIRHLNTFP